MLDPFIQLEELPSEPPVVEPYLHKEYYWLCQLVPPKCLNRELLTPTQADFCNYWLIRWNCTTRFLSPNQRDDWFYSLKFRSSIPDSQS